MSININPENLEKILNFLHHAENLKSTLRYSSTKSGRKESSAEHSWRLTLMVLVVTKELNLDLDIDHAIKIALVHDITESITGDIDAIRIAEQEISKEEKQKLEIKAIKKLKDSLSSKTGEEIYNLWNEYEQGSTKEAKFIKALDKIETLTQLAESGYKIYDKPEFIANYADRAVRNFPELTGMLRAVKQKLKSEFKKGSIPWKKEYDRF